MWIDVRNGFQLIDFILEGTTAKLDGNTITVEKHEINRIKQSLKNNNLETQYIIKERDHGKVVDYDADVYIYEDGYIGESPWDFNSGTGGGNTGKKVTAYIHSLKDKQNDSHILGEVEILQHNSDNNVVAVYNGVKCTAIYNQFTGKYYVDDVYGVIKDENK